MAQNGMILVGYYGMDGACAVAAALLKYPDAEVVITSARRIGATLANLSGSKAMEIHICGTGVFCDWEMLEQSALGLAAAGAKIYWHCGRDYLNAYVDRFERFCSPVFLDVGTNTAAVATSLGVASCEETNFLMELAWLDKRVTGARETSTCTQKQSDWMDFIEAATAQYLKYQDEETYIRAIRKLMLQHLDHDDMERITAFRQAGYRYLLHGKSPAIRQLKERIGKCARTDRNVLITGESGVGKEHVAHLLWEGSPQASGPFIALNCATYAGNINLANSDLFGHSKGAFTGADRNRNGKFTEADGGVLFLDELSELPLEVQAKLLRVIEDGSIIPEGADRPVRQVHVRVLAATNRDLPTQIRSGLFRPDLYHRISTLRIHIPPLRERLEDLEVILLEKLGLLQKEGYTVKWKPKDMKLLRDYSWPGNVRQFLKIVERAALLDMPLAAVMEEEKSLGELAEEVSDKETKDVFRPSLRTDVKPIKEIQEIYARHIWELFDGNYRATARAMAVNVNTLRYNYLNEAKAES